MLREMKERIFKAQPFINSRSFFRDKMKKDTLENLYDKFTEVSEVKTLVKKGVKIETTLIPNWKLLKVSLPLIRKLANDGYTLHDIEDDLARYIETKTNNDSVATLIAQPQP